MTELRSPETFERLVDVILGESPSLNPWRERNQYRPQYGLLERLLSIPVRQGANQPSGRFARATDAWIAQELRSAGFGENEVWPRRVQPRVLPQALADVEAIAQQGGIPAVRRAIKGWSCRFRKV